MENKWVLPVFIILLFSLFSCDEQGSEELALTGDATFVLGYESGAETMTSVGFNESWEVVNVPTWCTVSPMSGEAGNVDITVTARSNNEEIPEREDVFKIRLASSQEVEYWIIQRGTPSVSVKHDAYYALPGGEDITVNIEGNVPLDEGSFVPSSDWVSVKSVELPEPALLGDGKTSSEYYKGHVVLTVGGGTDGKSRSCSVVFGDNTPISVNQVAEFSDWDKEFYRHSVIQRFTATWCGYCPAMGEAFNQADEADPGRFVPVNLHPMNSDSDLAWEGTSYFEDLYSISEYPTSVINGIAKVGNQAVVGVISKMMTALADEAVLNFPSRTNIMAYSSLSGRDLHVDAFVAVKSGGNYRITAFLLEDGVVAAQSDGTGILTDPDNYRHEHIARALLTAEDGEPVTVSEENSVAHFVLDSTLPSSVIDKDNLSVAIYISYEGAPDEALCGVAGIQYVDSGYIIDNGVALLANGMAEYSFE